MTAQRRAQARAAAEAGSWRVVASYLEVYNEQVYDLLCAQEEQRALKPCEVGSSGEVAVSGLMEREVGAAAEVLALVADGNTRRRMEPTAANQVSSRSHAVLQVAVVHEEPVEEAATASRKRGRRHSVVRLDNTPAVKRTSGARPPFRAAERPVAHGHASILPQSRRRAAKLSLIDLAGSERASATKNRGARLHEGANINKARHAQDPPPSCGGAAVTPLRPRSRSWH